MYTADANALPISAMGDISPELPNILVSPYLSISFISVGQLVDDNHTISFSASSYLLLDQISRKDNHKGA